MNIVKTNFSYTNPLTPLVLDDIKYIILHHAEATIASPEDIHRWHLDNGWAGFGYNEYIRKDGIVYIGRGDFVGAQCQNYNSSSYGICCEGNFEQEMMNPVQLRVLIERIKYHKTRFKNYNCTAPHSQFCDTACPGKLFPLTRILQESEVKTMTFEEALKILVEKGVIQSPDYWLKVGSIVKYFDTFVINVASKL